jgi:Ser/Thr protein kinase RdoA (MazF antagonist)
MIARQPSTPARRQRARFPIFPVINSVPAPDALAAELAGAYALPGRARCELLQRGLNDTYLVRARGDRYVARVYRARWRSPGEIAYELELLAHLAGRGVGVSVPIAGRDGRLQRSLAAPEGSRQLVLFSYAAGSPLAWEREEHSEIAGRLAASVHAGADDFACAHPRRALDLEELLERPLAAVRPFLAHRPGDWQELVGIAARLRERIADAADSGLDWGVCHGDLGAGNLHVVERGEATLFDFDFCGPGWRAYDLIAPWRMSGRTTGGAAWRAFLRGYGQVRALSPADRAAVPLLDMAGRVWSLGLRAARAHHSGTARMADWYLDRVLASLSGAAGAGGGGPR